MRWEGNFHAIAFNNVTGMTYDGHEIDWTTGELADPLHYWSAPSKESIHFMMLAIALDPLADNAFNSKMASVFLSPDDPGEGRNVALQILTKKIASLVDWNRRYPGYGGFLPWFYNYDTGLVPADGWNSSVPALDNGEVCFFSPSSPSSPFQFYFILFIYFFQDDLGNICRSKSNTRFDSNTHPTPRDCEYLDISSVGEPRR